MMGRRELLDGAKRRPYAASVAMILIVTAIGFVTEPILHSDNLDAVYLLAVFASALYCGVRPAIFTAVLGACIFNFCFVAPRFRWGITDLPYLVTLIVFVVVAAVTTRLASQERQHVLDRAARDRAEALNASKDLILHKISHELRSPMTAVLGWVQFLRLDKPDEEQLAAGLSGLESSAQLMRRLVEDLLDASRAASGKLPVKLQPTKLAPAVAKALDIVSVEAQNKDIALNRALHDVVALADEARIEQIVTNLVYNATKFTPAGGKILVSLTSSNDKAYITVGDNGVGISDDFLPHLFEAFSQADGDGAHGGLGLGLSIVKYLVEAHSGTISVTSHGPGLGSTFVVTIPTLPGLGDPEGAEIRHETDLPIHA
jgi:K+-sensing histidine kinase KdpD